MRQILFRLLRRAALQESIIRFGRNLTLPNGVWQEPTFPEESVCVSSLLIPLGSKRVSLSPLDSSRLASKWLPEAARLSLGGVLTVNAQTPP